MKKYEFTNETMNYFGRTLYRIRALIEIRDDKSNILVRPGDLGGWVEHEDILSHESAAWIYGNAMVCDNTRVCNYAVVCDNAKVFGNAEVFGNAKVCDNALVSDNAKVYGDARVRDNAEVYGDAMVCDDAKVYGDAEVCDNAEIKKSENFLTIGPIGSRKDITTFFLTKDNIIKVKCGCFLGAIHEFLSKVESTHGNNKHATVYRLAVELAKEQIELNPVNTEY